VDTHYAFFEERFSLRDHPLRGDAALIVDPQILNYENRIRMFSDSRRVFRYFATRSIDGEPYMTPDDFVRAIVPGEMQPDGVCDVYLRRLCTHRHLQGCAWTSSSKSTAVHMSSRGRSTRSRRDGFWRRPRTASSRSLNTSFCCAF
jgi:hypothetical protein